MCCGFGEGKGGGNETEHTVINLISILHSPFLTKANLKKKSIIHFFINNIASILVHMKYILAFFCSD